MPVRKEARIAPCREHSVCLASGKGKLGGGAGQGKGGEEQ